MPARTPVKADAPRFDRGAAITRSLLGYGVVVGPFYLAVGVMHGLLREGFSLTRHPLSLLARGPGGWIQTTNFVLSGLMVIAAAVGFHRVLRPASRASSWFLGAFGLGMIIAAAFPADPMDGFPAGTPHGPPATISPTGMMHFAAGGLGFVALAVSALLAARAMSKRQVPAMAWLSFAAGLTVLLGFFGGFILPSVLGGTRGIWLAVVVGWGWLSVLSVHLYRASPSPNC